jgi:RimJ/RimL family protein N-acetyltransferase
MFQPLNPNQYPNVRTLFRYLDHHLAITSLLNGDSDGLIHVDNAEAPRAALCQVGGRFYLAGEPDIEPFNDGVRAHFEEVIYPHALDTAFQLYYDEGAGWGDVVETVLDDHYPMQRQHRYYVLRSGLRPWSLPDGVTLRAIDAALVADESLGSRDDLLEELQSERASVEDFLQRSFGFCALHDDAIVSLCTSEYNTGDRTELGINTMPEYRRLGIARGLVTHFVEHAFANGYTEIGWHCWADNLPSTRTAESLGFTRVRDYPALLAYFNPMTNFAANAEMRFWRGDYNGAVDWYERAFALGEPLWAYFTAAQAYAAIGQDTRAFDTLERLIDEGGVQPGSIETLPHFTHLHHTPRWQHLIRKIATQQEA